MCVRVCVSLCEQKPRLYINQATIFSDPNVLLCAYFLFCAATSEDLYVVLSSYSLELKTAALLG